MEKTRTRMQYIVLVVIAFSIVGCSAKLVAEKFVANDGPKGVVVSAPARYVISSQVRKLDSNGAPCGQATVKRDFRNLPFGENYSLNFERGFFANNGFSVAFHENGALKLVSLNSDPQIDETISATANLVKEVGALAAGAAPAVAPGDGPPVAPVCGPKTMEEIICVQTFTEWKAHPNPDLNAHGAGGPACP